jgi:hypothetical protein
VDTVHHITNLYQIRGRRTATERDLRELRSLVTCTPYQQIRIGKIGHGASEDDECAPIEPIRSRFRIRGGEIGGAREKIDGKARKDSVPPKLQRGLVSVLWGRLGAPSGPAMRLQSSRSFPTNWAGISLTPLKILKKKFPLPHTAPARKPRPPSPPDPPTKISRRELTSCRPPVNLVRRSSVRITHPPPPSLSPSFPSPLPFSCRLSVSRLTAPTAPYTPPAVVVASLSSSSSSSLLRSASFRRSSPRPPTYPTCSAPCSEGKSFSSPLPPSDPPWRPNWQDGMPRSRLTPWSRCPPCRPP